jgi:hypothetical protein
VERGKVIHAEACKEPRIDSFGFREDRRRRPRRGEAESKQRQPATEQAVQDRQAIRSSKKDKSKQMQPQIGVLGEDLHKEWIDMVSALRKLTETLREEEEGS